MKNSIVLFIVAANIYESKDKAVSATEYRHGEFDNCFGLSVKTNKGCYTLNGTKIGHAFDGTFRGVANGFAVEAKYAEGSIVLSWKAICKRCRKTSCIC
jgi:hypothetical protein